MSISRAVQKVGVEATPRLDGNRDMPNPTKGNGFRPDIQALRALAVSLVVIGHLWPNSLTGGYVGVDVFFVISGFLITTHLSKEILRLWQA